MLDLSKYDELFDYLSHQSSQKERDMILFEEFGELTKALVKQYRYPCRNYSDDMLSEYVDVLLMLYQSMRSHKISEEDLKRKLREKLSRTVQRYVDAPFKDKYYEIVKRD